ncbi:antigen 5 like allergen Cul n 1 isoform X2 [Drosophila eugracilis]|uniref:antigen 5 like allergen Cul n 1 isoform X2 n=1 Tax=Drosophila eugracilis TaxID=29029 RepID=UPI0007E71EAC|nr:antigen 5 like allergen Cul n 1 isoform X2 [Drosophila eugracilis]
MLDSTVFILFLNFMIYCMADNYCRPDLCPSRINHIACQNRNGSFGTNCPKNVTVVKLTQDHKNLLIKAHNIVRQKWASGKAKIRRLACKMATIEWNKDLENLALLNAKTCLMEHDYCHNTEKFRQSGQNLFAAGFWKSMPITTRELLEIAVQMWAGEERDIKASDLQKLPVTQPKVIGHLTVLINEKNDAVGCGLVSYTVGEDRKFNLACNYAYSNVLGQSVYSECPTAGSKCRKGLNSQYPALCA